jgi:hypothetical protein
VQITPTTTVLCGAGISVPSRLPDGQTLARHAFDLIWRHSHSYSPELRSVVHEALLWHPRREPALRLELLLELLARHLDSAVLVRIFELLRGATPNLAHFALLLSDAAAIVTTNQDDLLEAAAATLGDRWPAQRLLHLHGDCRRPASIITTISQYVAGLPEPTASTYANVVTGRAVVVVGYSGRDRDVMPRLRDAATVDWIHYEPPNRPTPLAIEVQALQADLGPRFRLQRAADPTALILTCLSRQVADTARAAARSQPPSSPGATKTPPSLTRACAALPSVERELAVARILLHLGRHADALAGLKRTEPRTNEHRATLPLLKARALLALNLRDDALLEIDVAAHVVVCRPRRPRHRPATQRPPCGTSREPAAGASPPARGVQSRLAVSGPQRT